MQMQVTMSAQQQLPLKLLVLQELTNPLLAKQVAWMLMLAIMLTQRQPHLNPNVLQELTNPQLAK